MSSTSTAVPDDGHPGVIDSASNLSVPTTVSRSFQLDYPSSAVNSDSERTVRPASLKVPLQKLAKDWEDMKKVTDKMILWALGKWKEAEEKLIKMEEEKRGLEWDLAERQLVIDELQMKLDDIINQTAVPPSERTQ